MYNNIFVKNIRNDFSWDIFTDSGNCWIEVYHKFDEYSCKETIFIIRGNNIGDMIESYTDRKTAYDEIKYHLSNFYVHKDELNKIIENNPEKLIDILCWNWKYDLNNKKLNFDLKTKKILKSMNLIICKLKDIECINPACFVLPYSYFNSKYLTDVL